MVTLVSVVSLYLYTIMYLKFLAKGWKPPLDYYDRMVMIMMPWLNGRASVFGLSTSGENNRRLRVRVAPVLRKLLFRLTINAYFLSPGGAFRNAISSCSTLRTFLPLVLFLLLLFLLLKEQWRGEESRHKSFCTCLHSHLFDYICYHRPPSICTYFQFPPNHDSGHVLIVTTTTTTPS